MIKAWLCNHQKSWVPEAAPLRSDPEQEWREKLLGECQDEFSEMFGQYDEGKIVILCENYMLSITSR